MRKSKFLHLSYKFKILKKLYLFYNLYIRNRKYLNNGSQFGEDKFLYNLFEKNYNGKYLDVGCFHPTKHNNTSLFYKNGWQGINIDLNPLTIDLFNFMRPNDININTAIIIKGCDKGYKRAFWFNMGHEQTPGIKLVHKTCKRKVYTSKALKVKKNVPLHL